MGQPSPTRLAILLVSSLSMTTAIGAQPGQAQSGASWQLEGMPKPTVQNAPPTKGVGGKAGGVPLSVGAAWPPPDMPQPTVQNAPVAKSAPKIIVAKPIKPRAPEAPSTRTSTTGSISPVGSEPVGATVPELPPRPPLAGKRALAAFKAAPFPYQGTKPYDDQPFLDHVEEGRRGRLSVRTGEVLWEDKVYADNRVLLYVPKDFAPAQPALMILYFHGHDSRLVRDVERRQGVLHQVEQAGLNAVVVAPQFALEAPDSSAGKFWQPGALATFVDEAVGHLARVSGNKRITPALQKAQIVIIAYSGGYAPAAWALHHGGISDRIAGVIVLDGMYGEYQKFADWIEQRRDAFFITAYGASSRDGNIELRRLIVDRPHRTVMGLAGKLERGAITFIAAPSEVRHQDFVAYAWTRDPITDLLMRLPQYSKR